MTVADRRAADRRPVGIVDVGSNSIRLVVYDGVRRAARMLFNEKVMCGLGRGLSETGRLNREGMALALENLQRFVALAEAIETARLDVLATAAVRDAEDGREFVAEMERRFAVRVRVLAGEEEGRLSGMGVLAGIPEAAGVAGDLGGGSVELVQLGTTGVGAAATLPLGPLRLAELAQDEKRLRDTIDRHLDMVAWLGERPGGAFYAVGGAWRALARIHMEQEGYPLHIIQQYEIAADDAQGFLDLVARQSRKSLERMATAISRKRLEGVPLAARVLARILRRMAPRRLVFSAFGLREGHLYSLLDKAEQKRDPLIAACAEAAQGNSRFGGDPEALFAWIQPLFPKEAPERRRLRRAIAHLSDIAWQEHPDYRAEQAMRHALLMPVHGIDHAARVFVASALHARYGGRETPELARPLALLDEDELRAARAIGTALRLGYTLSGGIPSLLAGTSLALSEQTLALTLAPDGAPRFGETVQRRLEAAARALGRRAEVKAKA